MKTVIEIIICIVLIENLVIWNSVGSGSTPHTTNSLYLFGKVTSFFKSFLKSGKSLLFL